MILLALALATGSSFPCDVVRIADGDTFTCSSGVKVRLRAVDAPEMGRCRKGRVCAPGNPRASKRNLSRMIAGKTLSCRADGRNYERITAWCRVGSVDLSCAQYRGGYAVRLPEYDRRRQLCR